MNEDAFFALLKELGAAQKDGSLDAGLLRDLWARAQAYPLLDQFSEPFQMAAANLGINLEGAQGETPADSLVPTAGEGEVLPEQGIGGEPVVFTDKKEEPTDPEEDVEVPIPKLASHQIDIPEEPETVRVITQLWDASQGKFIEEDLGELLLIPSGCEEPEYLSPYENTVSFKSALPRDKQIDANLYGAYQKMGTVSREWIRENSDEEIDGVLEDKRIADDIPILLAMQGKPDVSSGVAQTAGLEGKGDNNGAPLPPGPGPGRGNTSAPGDNGASAPANAAPGSPV